MLFKQLVSLVASIAAAQATSKGFNSGNVRTDGTPKSYDDFAAEFKKGMNLPGTSGWNSIRLYTNIQGGTTADPISAFQAAIDTKTQMLLGMWASGGDEGFNNEITALKSAIDQYGSDFTDLVVGISVGSEDLYRISVTGQENDSDVGVGPDVLVEYIQQTKKAIAGTGLSGAPIGHVDTWDAWSNGTNSAVAENCDWLGMDTYPYFEYQKDNSIDNAKQLFWDAYDKTKAAAGGKDVWITETGWPVSGKTEGQGVPSPQNAEKYWQDVSCELQNGYTVFWYTLQDALPDVPNPSFGIIGQDINSDPLYSLSCKNTTSSSSSSSSSASSSSTRSHRHGHATAAASGSASASVSESAGAYATGSANGYGGNSTMSAGSSASASAYGGAGGAGGYGGASSPPTPTASSGASGSASASGAPVQSGNSAATAGSAMGAGLLAFFGLAAVL